MTSLPPVHCTYAGGPYAEEWIIEESQKGRWEALLEESQTTHQKVNQLLTDHKIASLHFGEAPSSPLSVLKKRSKPPVLLWENNELEIYSPPAPRVQHHLWVVLKRPIDNFSEVTSEDAVHLREAVNRIMRCMKESLGLSTFTAQWNLPQPGQFANRFTIEILPPRLESKKVHNLWDKLESNNYIFYRGKLPTSIPPPTRQETKNNCAFWKKTLAALPPAPFSTLQTHEPIAIWRQTQTHKAQAMKALLDCIHAIAQEKQLRIVRKELPERIEMPDLSLERTGCVFCTEDVLNAEKIYETPLSYVLPNFKPAIPGSHFLILPKRHVETSDSLREDEVRDIHELSLKLTKILKEKELRHDVVMYQQDGTPIGQSVLHSHMHVMLTPPPLHYMLFWMNYGKMKTQTTEEMQPLIVDIRQRLEREYAA